VSELAITLIEENIRTKSNSLDLGNCGLTKLPNELFICTWLEYLDLSNEHWDSEQAADVQKTSGAKNKLTSLKGIENLKNLKSLRLNGDKGNYAQKGEIEQNTIINDLFLLENLSELNSLYLNNNKIEDLSFLNKLQNLTSLEIRRNQISDIGPLENLTKLKWLDIAHNTITKITSLAKIQGLTNLYASFNEIDDLSPLENLLTLEVLYLSYNKITDVTCLKRLLNLEQLRLGGNNFSTIDSLSNLKKLKSLAIFFLKLKNIGPISNLPSIEELELDSNSISNILPLTNLTTLSILDLRKNQIEKIPLEFFEKMNLEINLTSDENVEPSKIYLSDNPIISPPLDVLKQGRNFTLEYLKNENKQPLNECKVIILGRGAVGKTSLQKRLFGNEPFDINESETHGIRKRTWLNDIKDGKYNPINVHFWDFGGQHIQQTLHQLFYTDNTVYLLVLDNRIDEDPEDFLELIRVYGNNSPTIIVYNYQINLKKEKSIVYNLYPELDSSLRNKYPSIRKVFGVCCGQDNDPGMINLKEYLISYIPTIDHVREKYPVSWLKIKESLLKQVEQNYILFKDYMILCKKHQVDQVELQKGLAKMLNTVGAITFFDKQFLGDYYILNPDWLTTGAYQIILSDRTKNNKGRIGHADLEYIFSSELPFKYVESDYEFILKLMREFDLCHEFAKNEWLIPSSLEGKSKTDLVDFLKGDFRKYCIRFTVSLPESVIHRFIARNIKYSFNTDYWRNGIVVKHPESNTILFVEADRKDKEIRLWIKGDRIRDCWEYFRKDFKDFSDKFLYDEYVGVNEDGTGLVSYKKLMNLWDKRLPNIENWYDPDLNIEINVPKTLGLFEDLEKKISPREKIENKFPPSPKDEKSENDAGGYLITPTSTSKEKLTISVKKWKWNAMYLFIISLIITILIIVCYVNEFHFIASKTSWVTFKNSDLAKWGGIIITFLWNVFVGRIVYDRWLDPSKEKAFRESYK